MLKNKRKKVEKNRGSHTHGCGSKKKRRGAGNRGGRGLAGTGKRADQNKSRLIKNVGLGYFGGQGFKPPRRKEVTGLNIGFVGENFDQLVDAGIIKKEKEGYVLNLKESEYDKLLGQGSIEQKLIVISDSVSEKAREKIENAGGEVRNE